MPVTPIFAWPYPELGNEANVPSDIEKAAKAIENTVKELEPKRIKTAGVGDAKKLLIVQGTGSAAFQAMSGDATITELGVMTVINEAITAAKILALAVTEAKIGNEAVSTTKIATLAITANRLAASAVETAKINNLAVTEEKLAALAVGTAKLAALAVTEEKIANGAVGPAKIGVIPSVKAFSKAETEIPLTTLTAMPMAGEKWKTTAGFHSTVSNTHRLVAPIDGLYEVTGFVMWNPKAVAEAQTFIYLLQNAETLGVIGENAPFNFDAVVAPNGVASHSHRCTATFDMVAGEYIAMMLYVGATARKIQNGNAPCYCSATWLGPKV